MIKKLLKISAWVLLVFFLLAGVLTFAIRTAYVQTKITGWVTGYLSDELGVQVQVGKIYIRFFSDIVIEDVFVADQQSDTLLQAGKITAAIELFSLKNNKLYFSDISINDGTIKIIKYPNKPGLNFKFILDYFASDDTSGSSTAFDFNPGEIQLHNISFAYIDKRYTDVSRGIDFEDIRVDSLEADIDNIEFAAGTVFLDLNQLSFIEKSGFKLDYMESHIGLSANQAKFDDLLVKTAESNIQGWYIMEFDSIEDFEEYITNVRMKAGFENSQVSFNDLRYFAPELNGLDQQIEFSGNARGTVSQLKGKNLFIKMQNGSYFKGDVSLSGLPEIDETFFDLVVDQLSLNKSDLESIPTYPFDKGEKIVLPENIDKLGTVKITGKFTGFMNDFVAYGNATTAIGYISSDINLKFDNSYYGSKYSGQLSAIGFDIGTFTGSAPDLGKVSGKVKVDGKGFSVDKATAKMAGQISQIEISGYDYHNITINGELSKKLFNGQLYIEEPNLGLDFKGSVDFTGAAPEYIFTTDIRHAHLTNLSLIDRDSSASLDLKAEINIRGKDMDELTGYINAYDIRYTELNDSINVSKIYFTSERGNNVQQASLRSDLLDFDMSGQYKRTFLLSSVQQVASNYLPVINEQKKQIPYTNFNLRFTLHDISDVLRIFVPELQVSPGTYFTGKINNRTNELSAQLLSDSIEYSAVHLKNILLNAQSNSTSSLDVDLGSSMVTIADTLKFPNLNIYASSKADQASFKLKVSPEDSIRNFADLSGKAQFKKGETDITLEPAVIGLAGNTINILKETMLGLSDSSLIVNDLYLSSNDSYVKANGVISSRPEDELKLDIQQFDTRLLNPVLAIYDFNMGGTATGVARLSGLLGKPQIEGNVSITDLSLYGDTLGDATAIMNFNTQLRTMTMQAYADRGGTRNIELNGKITFTANEDSLDFDIILKKTNIAAFAGYASDLVSDVRGKASGNMKLKGTIRRPLITGTLRLQQTSFLVNFLQTRYNFSDVVHFDNKAIRFDHIKVNDLNGNQADVSGAIKHTYLKDFTFDIDINAKNFQALNTQFTDNELFYGTAFATGKVTVRGTPDLLFLNMILKTEKNTLIEIPLSNPDEISKSSFITFINTTDSTAQQIKKETKITGINMKMEINATPDAEVRLIFDSKIGDVIKGRGEGNLNITLDALGEFLMYGRYEVVSGDYLFTLQNLLNKKFIITPGGSIRWSGSPYDAEIDLEGVYKLKASLYDLFQDTSFKKRIPVEVILKLSDNLFNPNIKFDIKVPDVDPTTQTLINRYINTEQELNKQTMSLLVLNRFSRAADVEYSSGSSSSGLSANVSEVLSQQLSVWASQISTAFDVGVNYRAADQFSQEELEVALSTNLFDDRVTIDGAVNVSENNQTTSNLVGDFNVEVKVSKDGRLRFKAFNKSVENTITNNYASQYTQGIGVFYREEFNSFGDLVDRFRNHFKKEDPPPPTTPDTKNDPVSGQ